MALPSHLRFLEDLAEASPGDLAEHFPETASGELQPTKWEAIFEADGIGYIGNKDGTMVPVDAADLESMPENQWDPQKFAALVQAVATGEHPLVHPGYADIWIEDGELHAQVRDGNHRTFAPIAAGGSFSWVMMSDRTAQRINERDHGSDELYRAIRARQKAYGAPLFKRRQVTKVKSAKFDELLAAERAAENLRREIDRYYQHMLDEYGPAKGPHSLHDQKQRPQLFWKMRLKELAEEHGPDWVYDNIHESEAGRTVQKAQEQLSATSLYDLRKAAGLQHGERLDPETGQVVRP